MGAMGAAVWSGDEDDDGRDRYLDAFARVVQRHGLSRARVRDVAEEAGVSRVTVYRQVGTIPEMTALLIRRELARVLPDPTTWLDGDDPVGGLVGVLAEIATLLRTHPLLDKVITDEPHLLGQYLVRDLPRVLEESAAVGAAVFQDGMRRGKLAARDPHHVADWVARALLTAVIAPPRGPMKGFLEAGLRPLLEPQPEQRTRRRRS